MPNTLFVVDDSATMRKVFELTFAGEDVTVVTHDGTDGVMAKLREVRPQAAIVDVALGAQSTGYDLVRSIRAESSIGSIPIYLLYSEHSPLDESSARSCGALGAIVKPFETQVLIDKVRQALATGAKGTITATTGNVTAPFGNPQASPTPVNVIPPAPAKPAEPVGFSAPRPGGILGGIAPKVPTGPTATQKPLATPAGATSSGAFGAPVARPPLPPAARPVAPPPAAPAAPVALKRPAPAAPAVAIIDDEIQFEAPAEKPAPKATEPVAEKPAVSVHEKVTAPVLPPAADALVHAVSHAVEQRVAGLGLTPAQVEAVTALTRDVVERVVWEVVPQLAETMIREELKRLTAA